MYPPATFYSSSARVEPRMQRSALEPFFIAWFEIEINNRRKPKGEISSGNLVAVCSPEFWMGSDCILIQRCGAAHMDVRIDQARDEESSPAIDSPGVLTGNQVRTDFNDLAIAKYDISMKQWGAAFR